ncbi:MAG: hypothetical protein SF028_13475 [Candidatus Sumerlaeia bacterium]|nr:hypothetical protein [Candidatus Sumerlaeia bacterium]
MSRPSQLLYSAPNGGEPQPLLVSPDRIPLLWLFCFGARNTVAPGESVLAARAAHGDANSFSTRIEDAEFRLDQVRSTLEPATDYWAWIAALPSLRGRVTSKSRQGVLRLEAPWATNDPDNLAALRRSIAFLENAVNMISIGRADAVRAGLGTMEPFCPFVVYGDGSDWGRLQAAVAHGENPTLALARLTLGSPSRPGDPFLSAAAAQIDPYAPRLAKTVSPPKAAAPAAAALAEAKPGLLGKLGGLFKKK